MVRWQAGKSRHQYQKRPPRPAWQQLARGLVGTAEQGHLMLAILGRLPTLARDLHADATLAL